MVPSRLDFPLLPTAAVLLSRAGSLVGQGAFVLHSSGNFGAAEVHCLDQNGPNGQNTEGPFGRLTPKFNWSARAGVANMRDTQIDFECFKEEAASDKVSSMTSQ